MTRINANIPVETLTNKHLLAEHREIKRICFRLQYRLKTNNFKDIPSAFYTINKKGEIVFKELFWLDKGKFTLKRYKQIHQECIKRGFNVTDFSKNWEIYNKKPEFFNDYIPTDEQNLMISERIKERNSKSKIGRAHV